ncbi:MAG: arginine--tRNA ligase [Proteobacteria bacterium]|nr:arginine--tRNA ligase [Pseudomonadota bacterium]
MGLTKSSAYHALAGFVAEELCVLFSYAEWDLSSSSVVDCVTKKVIQEALERPKDISLGDFALPCFFLAKPTRLSPSHISKALVASAQKESLLSSPQKWIGDLVAVGGFLNITLNVSLLAEYVFSTLKLDGSRGWSSFCDVKNTAHFATQTREFLDSCYQKNARPRKVMIEYSQPNTHKVFHVGHSRNVCLGQSLCLLHSYMGDEVVAVNYIGDEGTHIAKCLAELAKHPQKKPSASQRASEFYNDLYVRANTKIEDAKAKEDDTDDSYHSLLSSILRELESKSGAYYELWLDSKQRCMDDFLSIYKWLDVEFDHIYYESELTTEAQEILETYSQKGLFTLSDGALGLCLKEKDLGFMMVRKSDGNTLYITKDLALAYRKKRDFCHIHDYLYVVGNEQNYHFKQLFACLELMGLSSQTDVNKPNFEHISYGMVVLPDGKMSSRKGNTVGFWQLVEMLEGSLKAHLSKYEGRWSDEEMSKTLQMLICGTMKWGMLAQDPQKQLIFDSEAWCTFEGDTGPYVMYAYARACSILKKAEQVSKLKYLPWQTLKQSSDKLSSYERVLLFEITRFAVVCLQAKEQHKPSLLCHYLLEISRIFSRFYKYCPILASQESDLIDLRLLTVQAFATVLTQGLKLLGILPPESM